MQSHSDRNSSVPLGHTSGPLYSYIPRFTASLTSRGYSKASIAYRLTCYEISTSGCDNVGCQ